MRPLSILLADDEATVRQLVTICLERKSFVVLPPSSGEEALQMARSRQEFDLLLTDVQVGGDINGIELAVRILEEKPGIRLLVIPGSPDSLRMAAEKGLPVSAPFPPLLSAAAVQPS